MVKKAILNGSSKKEYSQFLDKIEFRKAKNRCFRTIKDSMQERIITNMKKMEIKYLFLPDMVCYTPVGCKRIDNENNR